MQRLTDDLADHLAPVWSPNCQLIATKISRRNGMTSQLCVTDAVRGATRRSSVPRTASSRPGLSPPTAGDPLLRRHDPKLAGRLVPLFDSNQRDATPDRRLACLGRRRLPDRRAAGPASLAKRRSGHLPRLQPRPIRYLPADHIKRRARGALLLAGGPCRIQCRRGARLHRPGPLNSAHLGRSDPDRDRIRRDRPDR